MFAKTRTWIVHKDRYGNELPTPQYQSDLRENRMKQVWKKSGLSGAKKPKKIEGFTPEDYIRETVWVFSGLMFIIGLLYYVAPSALRFLGLY